MRHPEIKGPDSTFDIKNKMKNLLLLILFTNASYTYSQTSEQAPEGKAIINVIVVSNLKIPIENQEVSFVSVKNKKVYSGISKKDGKIQLFIPIGDKYTVQYQSVTSKKEYTVMEIPDAEGVVAECELTITPGTTFTLDNVFFDTGKSTLKPESFTELDELLNYMSQKKTTVIEISGHTDNVGGTEANQKLSQDRANSVKNYLVKKGISTSRVEAKGYGDTLPIAENTDEAGRKQNRRTEVKILKQ